MTDRKETLLDAAEKSIRQRGYHAVSFRDLADELDIKSASVHYYFRQKHELGTAVVERYRQKFFDNLSKASKGATTEEQKLKALIKVYKKSLNTSGLMCLCGMMGAENNGLPQEVSEAVNAFFKANIDWVIAALDSERNPTQKGRKAKYIVATLQGAIMLSTSLKDRKIFDQATSELI